MKTFFTADTHFGHANIIKYCGRPFSSSAEMDETIISNWNKVVGQKDIIYHLGDFSMGDINFVVSLLDKLNGHIFYVFGNHDKEMRRIYEQNPNKWYTKRGVRLNEKITFLGEMAEVNIEGLDITLNHYAMRTWNRSHYGNWHLYGHSHGALPDDPTSLSFDVGVDVHGFCPISVEQVAAIMAKKTYVPLDNHKAKTHEGTGSGLSREEYSKLERKRQYEMLKQEFDGKP